MLTQMGSNRTSTGQVVAARRNEAHSESENVSKLAKEACRATVSPAGLEAGPVPEYWAAPALEVWAALAMARSAEGAASVLRELDE